MELGNGKNINVKKNLLKSSTGFLKQSAGSKEKAIL